MSKLSRLQYANMLLAYLSAIQPPICAPCLLANAKA